MIYLYLLQIIGGNWLINTKSNKALIVTDENGSKFVAIPQIIFYGKRTISWDDVEKYLLHYVGEIIQMTETDDIIYIGKDFTDEFTGSKYTKNLKGALAKAKANMVQGIPEMIEIATGKRWSEDFEKKHSKRAEKGWYRYNSRFALPVLDEDGNTMRYNMYQAVLIVRYASNNKLYLYDIQNIKKETSNPS